jgi:hypothetical protein
MRITVFAFAIAFFQLQYGQEAMLWFWKTNNDLNILITGGFLLCGLQDLLEVFHRWKGGPNG